MTRTKNVNWRCTQSPQQSDEVPLQDQEQLQAEDEDEEEDEEGNDSQTVLPGRCITEKAFIGTPIFSLLQDQDFIFFLSLENIVPNDLVKEFYTNLQFDSESKTLTSNVRGHDIKLTPSIISKIFNLPNKGYSGYKVSGWPSDVDTDEKQKCLAFITSSSTCDNPYPFLKKHFDVPLRIALTLLQNGIVCKARHDGSPSCYEMYLLYLFFKKKPINLCAIMLEHMHKAFQKQKGLPYGIALGHLFKHFGIPIPQPKRKKLNASYYFNLSTLQRMRIWYYNNCHINSIEFEALSSDTKSRIRDAVRRNVTITGDELVPCRAPFVPPRLPSPDRLEHGEGSSSHIPSSPVTNHPALTATTSRATSRHSVHDRIDALNVIVVEQRQDLNNMKSELEALGTSIRAEMNEGFAAILRAIKCRSDDTYLGITYQRERRRRRSRSPPPRD